MKRIYRIEIEMEETVFESIRISSDMVVEIRQRGQSPSGYIAKLAAVDFEPVEESK